MAKYHKSIGIPENIKAKAKDFIRQLSSYKMPLSNHAFEALQEEGQQESIRQALEGYRPSYSEVFEIVEYGHIEKIGFRIPFNNRDIVFIVNSCGKIVTIWTNDRNDNHVTLNAKNYNMALA